jgi:exodeoxyribonuclease VII small subunit
MTERRSGKANTPDDGLDFEAAFGRLQEAIGQLERGGLSLEMSIATFEHGMALANRCTQILDAAELRVTRVLESSTVALDEPAF